MPATVSGIHLSGTHAARPAANTVPDGSLYSCTTDGLIYKSNYAGNSWSTWATLGGTAGEKTKVSANDTTAGYLNGKLVAGTNITLTENADGGNETLTIAAGSSTGYAFPLDVPPGSAHAKDDEFSGDALDAKWTSPLSSGADLGVTTTLANGWLSLEPITAGSASTGKRLFGIRQTAPTGSFTVSGRLGNPAYLDDDATPGIFVARTASTTAHFWGPYSNNRTFGRAIATALYSETADAGGYDGYVVDHAMTVLHGGWYRIVWDSAAGSISFYGSGDGVRWWLHATRTSQAQPDRIGIAIYSNTGVIKANHQLNIDWFRVTEP